MNKSLFLCCHLSYMKKINDFSNLPFRHNWNQSIPLFVLSLAVDEVDK